jgi:hypothetical protein
VYVLAVAYLHASCLPPLPSSRFFWDFSAPTSLVARRLCACTRRECSCKDNRAEVFSQLPSAARIRGNNDRSARFCHHTAIFLRRSCRDNGADERNRNKKKYSMNNLFSQATQDMKQGAVIDFIRFDISSGENSKSDLESKRLEQRVLQRMHVDVESQFQTALIDSSSSATASISQTTNPNLFQRI